MHSGDDEHPRPTHLGDVARAVAPGTVRMWFCGLVLDELARLEAASVPQTGCATVTVAWERVPPVDRAIADMLAALADIALARWPDWYGEAGAFQYAGVGEGIAPVYDEPTIHRLGAGWPSIDAAWVRQAVMCCRRGARPLPPGFANQIHARQLALALAPDDLLVVLVMQVDQAEPVNLLCFARAAAWLAGETGARVAAFVPALHRHAAELDAINYGAFHVSREAAEAPAPAPDVGDEPARVTLPYIIGQPHPASPGEQRLAEFLRRDAELAPLFEFNLPVETSHGDFFIADLLWAAGKLAVEVDGYGWHSSPHTFANDRYRDYRLMCDGYRTLRLPHDEVMSDPALQCEKIRDIVHVIQREHQRHE